jgi:hypothetical protein
MKIPVKSQYFHAKPVLLSGAKRSEKDAYSRGAIREAKLCWLNPVFRKLISIAAFLQLILHRLKDYL